MHTLKALTAFLTLTAFLLNGPYGIPFAEAQTGTSTANANVPNYAPSNMSAALGMATNSLAGAMAACGAGITGDKNLQSLAVNAIAGTKPKIAGKPGSGGDCFKAVANKFACDMACLEPTDLMDGGSCDEYYQQDKWNTSSAIGGVSTKKSHSFLTSGEADLKANQTKLRTYLAFLTFKASDCVQKTVNDVSAEYKIYQCQMKALAGAVQQASSQLQQALTQNSQNFTKMTQFTKQVGDQMAQIDEILGPDPSDPNAKGGGGDQFQGLLGIQKNLGEQLNQWTGAEATFKTSVDQIQKDTDTNNQTLEADRMAQVTDCMKGNTNLGVAGGRSLTCYKPITTQSKDATGAMVSAPSTDSNGNVRYAKQACGALEYVRSQLEQAPLKQINNSSHQAKSQELTLEFDSMVNSMMRDMGSYDAATADGKLIGRTTSWSDLQKKYAGDMQDLSAKTGVNVSAQMNSVASSCYSASDNWKNQQLRSSASTYNKKKSEITANTNKLNAQLTQGLSDMNKEYGSAMSMLTNGQALSIDRTSCTNTDPAKMQSCYSDIKGKLQSIMDGTGAVGTTTKSIAGGSMLTSFSVSCKGINGCVTTYQNVRKMKKDQLKAGQKATEDFVNQGNTQIQNQLQGFASYLGTLQQQVNTQFGNMQGMLANLGIDSSAKPNFMHPDQLQPMKGPNGEMGPFESPKSMAAVLSGMVQPTGLMDFQDTGVQDILKAAQDKAKSDKADINEKLRTYASGQKKLSNMAATCTKDDDLAERSVGSVDENQCHQFQKTCADKLTVSGDGTSPTGSMNGWTSVIFSALNGSATSMNKFLSLSSDDQQCKDIIEGCRWYINEHAKSESGSDDKQGTPKAAAKANPNG